MSSWRSDSVFVRLKNVGERALVVPLTFPVDGADSLSVELQGSGTGDDWRPLTWRPAFREETISGAAPSPASVSLLPGRCAVMRLTGWLEGDAASLSFVNARISCTRPAREDQWTGTLSTPAFSAWLSDAAFKERSGALPFPDHFPPLSREQAMWQNMSGMESVFEMLSESNRHLMKHLSLYPPDEVAAELEKRLGREEDYFVKLLLATEAAMRGSDKAREHLTAWRTSTDFQTVLSGLDALSSMGRRENSEDAPEWLADELIAALRDERKVYRPPARSASGAYYEVWLLADDDAHATIALGEMKCRKAVPALVEVATRRSARYGWSDWALADIGGPEAIACLMQILEKQAAEARSRLTEGDKKFDFPPQGLALALGRLKARRAVPIFLEFLGGSDVIEALREMGDPAVVPHLRKLVAARGRFTWNGVPLWSKLDRMRLDEARVAIAALEEGDRIPRYAALLSDMSLGESERINVIRLMIRTDDPRVVPHLVQATKSDPSGIVVYQAIGHLKCIEARAAVEGLFECFDADFEGKSLWKIGADPKKFRASIAHSLRALTGQSFGSSKAIWQRWWEKSGKDFAFPEE
jgi:hypothetical protein